jgi:hypothetical protein
MNRLSPVMAVQMKKSPIFNSIQSFVEAEFPQYESSCHGVFLGPECLARFELDHEMCLRVLFYNAASIAESMKLPPNGYRRQHKLWDTTPWCELGAEIELKRMIYSRFNNLALIAEHAVA